MPEEKTWEQMVPSAAYYDWIQLTSDEWLKGDLEAMYDGKLEFDSDELDMLSLDFEDIRQIRSARVLQVRMLGNIDRVGRLLMADGRSAFRDISPKASRSTSNARAITSRNRPVPAAHLSFIAKSFTPPSSVKRIALLSCPPMSMTDRIAGSMK